MSGFFGPSGSLAIGGTGADLSGTGGTGQVLKQTTAGGAITVGAITAAEMAAIFNTVATNDIVKKNSSGELAPSGLSDDGSKITVSRLLESVTSAALQIRATHTAETAYADIGVTSNTLQVSAPAAINRIAILGAVSGNYGITVGLNTTASDGSISVGYTATSVDHGIAIGRAASAVASAVAIGYSASATGNYGVAIGRNAASGSEGLAAGYAASCGTSAVAVGRSATVPGTYGVGVGRSASVTGSGVGVGYGVVTSSTGVTIGYAANNGGYVSTIALGYNAVNTAASQFVAGSISSAINTVYFGVGPLGNSGVTPNTYSLRGSNAQGTDIVGGGINIDVGASTGAGASAVGALRAWASTTSGTTLQTTPVNVLTWSRTGIGLNGAAPVARSSAIADATNEADAVTKLNLLLAYLRSRGDIAA